MRFKLGLEMNRFVVPLLAGLACFSALSQEPSPSPTNATGSSSLTPAATLESTAAIASSTTNDTTPVSGLADSNYTLDDKHKLMPGDRLSFQIVEDRTNAIPLVVTEFSELEVPYIGRISVAGKTCKQLAAEIKVLLEKDYYYHATVIIGLDALSKSAGRVYIVGPVRNPGPQDIPANENFTVAKAILCAGGFGDFANRKDVQVVRKTPGGNKIIKVNVAEVMKGKTDEDVKLQDGDFIIVPERAWNL